VCPECGDSQTRRFCEADGYDSQRPGTPPPAAAPPPGTAPPDTAPPDTAPPDTAPPDTAPPDTAPPLVAVAPFAVVPLPVVASPPVAVPPSGVAAEVVADAGPGVWQVVVTADREYFDFVMAEGGAEAAALAFPRYYPIRRFELRGPEMLIGRHSTSRGINPEIDLSGAPEDLVVSHAHAQLLARPAGRWALVDLKSLNRTYLNDYRAAPVRAETELPLGDGDRVYLGAWTRLTVHAPPAAG
jgi:hypothetical protein